MRKELFYYLVVVWITLFSAPAKGYTQKDKNRQDSLIVFRMLETAESLFKKNNYDSAIYISRQAISYSLQHNYLMGQAWSIIKLNDLLIVNEELTEPEKNIPVLFRLGMQLKDSEAVAISFLQKAQVQLYQDKYDSAIINFEKSLNYCLEKKQDGYTALAYGDLGFTWGRKEDLEKMVSNCLKSLSIYEKLQDPVGCASALGNLAVVYGDLGQKDKAIEYSKKAVLYREKAGDINKLALACCNLSQTFLGNNIAEAVKYQQLCVKYAEQSGSEDRLIHSYITSSLVANAQKKNQEAFEYELKVIGLLETSRSDLIMLSRRYIAAAFLADMLKKDSIITLSYFNKSMQLSKEINNKTNQRDLFLFMSNFYIRKNNFEEAYKNYKKHILYRDSISSIEKQQNIDELEKKYQTAKKDVEIERLNSNQRINQLEIEKQQAIINGNKLEAMQKTNEISILQQQQQLQNLRLSTQEEELQKQQLQTKNKDQELALVQKEQLLNERRLENQQQLRNGIIAGTILLILLGGIGFSRYQLKKKLEQQTVMQEMRNHIASDLHDDIGASLSNINILNELTRRNAANPQKVKEYLTKASEDIRQVSEGISDIVWNINPRYDDLAHLFVRMKRYASDILDGKNIDYTIQFPEQAPDWKLGMDKRRDLYLLFKEAVNNLAKYSNATMAIIELWLENGRVRLSINDNGIGFEASSLKVGNGLQNMKDRAVLLKGNLSINSSPGKGTQLLLDMSM